MIKSHAWGRNHLRIDDHQIKKALVTVTIEKVLSSVGKPALEKVSNHLYTDYHSGISDCYEHPEYLKNTLKKIYGIAYKNIVESIKKELESLQQEAMIARFLSVMVKCEK